MSYYLFLVIVPNIDEGQKIARILVESKLAACVNIIKNIFSIYRWKGEIQNDNEHLLLIKTIEVNCESLIQKVNEIHSYSVPECIAFKIEKGSETYLKWIEEATK